MQVPQQYFRTTSAETCVIQIAGRVSTPRRRPSRLPAATRGRPQKWHHEWCGLPVCFHRVIIAAPAGAAPAPSFCFKRHAPVKTGARAAVLVASHIRRHTHRAVFGLLGLLRTAAERPCMDERTRICPRIPWGNEFVKKLWTRERGQLPPLGRRDGGLLELPLLIRRVLDLLPCGVRWALLRC